MIHKRLSNPLVLIIAYLLHFSALLGNPSIAEKTSGMKSFDGFVKFYWDDTEGKIWLEIERFNEEFLYVNGMATGIGSNDIGLDRTQLGSQRIVYFERRGPKVFMTQPNLMYRAENSSNPVEKQSVRDAFAESIVWGFKIEAEESGRVLIDLTSFLSQDHRNISTRLASMNEGQFSFDPNRTAVYLPRTRNFTDNSEFEITITMKGTRPGPEIRSVAPTANILTIRQHHSFIRLSAPWKTRDYHVMCGYSPIMYRDYTALVGEDMTRRIIRRHRLEKKDPEADLSDPIEPIVYYLDPGTPEPVRSALIEGGRWWNQAFEAAGYRDAFRVEVLPPEADPMDVRYNVINWLHRSTRGWSYGSSITDPRTGEILKGHVNLGSLRIRQDYLIAEGLLSPYQNGIPGNNPMLKMALARIRQLSAHEIGHTLGLTHNFAASTTDRASVMDYPHPKLVRQSDGTVDLTDAYDSGIGEWDKLVIEFGYQDFPEGTDEKAELDEILRHGYKGLNLKFISDGDSRPKGGMHPLGHLWDNGADAVTELENILKIRSDALNRFSASNIRSGRPMATLEEVLVPVFFLHRYQTEAVSKLVAGLEYEYQLRNGWQDPPSVIPGNLQHKALEALLHTIDPQVLRIPDQILAILPPRPPAYPTFRELFDGYMGLAFDPLAGAESAAQMTVSLLLNPQRAARLIYFSSIDSNLPGLREVIDRLLEQTWRNPNLSGMNAEINRSTSFVILDHMLSLATSKTSSMQVKAITHSELKNLKGYLKTDISNNDSQRAAQELALDLIENYIRNPTKEYKPITITPPPGSPIGSCGF